MSDKAEKCDPDLLRGNTDILLLHLINEKGGVYGYRLIKDINSRSQGFFHLKEGTVYPLLHKLESEGLIEGRWQKLSNGTERRCYRITKQGIDALQERLGKWQSFRAAMELILEPLDGDPLEGQA